MFDFDHRDKISDMHNLSGGKVCVGLWFSTLMVGGLGEPSSSPPDSQEERGREAERRWATRDGQIRCP